MKADVVYCKLVMEMYRYTNEDCKIIEAARKDNKDKRAEKRLYALELRASGKSLAEAAKESGFAEVAFERAEEKATNSFLYSLAMGMSAYGNMDMGFSTMSVDDRLFLAETKVTRRFAQEGPCVIVGRCADYVLKDLQNVVNVFVMADLPARIKRAVENYDLPREKAETSIIKFDKRRSNYYNYPY